MLMCYVTVMNIIIIWILDIYVALFVIGAVLILVYDGLYLGVLLIDHLSLLGVPRIRPGLGFLLLRAHFFLVVSHGHFLCNFGGFWLWVPETCLHGLLVVSS